MDEKKCTITLTFGDQAENHAGMQKIGRLAERGYMRHELQEMKKKFKEKGAICEMYNLKYLLPEEIEFEGVANFLVIRKGVDYILGDGGADELFNEIVALPVDKKAFMKGRVVNKKARYNLCFAEEDQEPDYENKKGRIVSFSKVPNLSRLRNLLPKYAGENSKGLMVEENMYYDVSQCGIGFHGDGERKIVIGCRLGCEMPFHYQWYQRSKPVGERLRLTIGHGDLYVMSEKATGYDWLKKKIPTLRHAAGSRKFTDP